MLYYVDLSSLASVAIVNMYTCARICMHAHVSNCIYTIKILHVRAIERAIAIASMRMHMRAARAYIHLHINILKKISASGGNN